MINLSTVIKQKFQTIALFSIISNISYNRVIRAIDNPKKHQWLLSVINETQPTQRPDTITTQDIDNLKSEIKTKFKTIRNFANTKNVKYQDVVNILHKQIKYKNHTYHNILQKINE